MHRFLAVGVVVVGVLASGEPRAEQIPVPVDLQRPDLSLCSAPCPPCGAGEVCAHEVNEAFEPVCIRRCTTSDDCQGTPCLDQVQPDGGFRQQPACLPSSFLRCLRPGCGYASLRDTCQSDSILATPYRDATGMCGYQYVRCEYGCVATGGGWDFCDLPPDGRAPSDLRRRPDLSSPLDLQRAQDLRRPRDMGPSVDSPGCSCSLSPTATTGLNLAGIAVGLCLLWMLLRRGRG